MKKKKKLNYCNNETVVGIHTGSGVSKEIIDLDDAEKSGNISYAVLRKVRKQDAYED